MYKLLQQQLVQVKISIYDLLIGMGEKWLKILYFILQFCFIFKLGLDIFYCSPIQFSNIPIFLVIL